MKPTSETKFQMIGNPSVVDQIIETMKQALIRGELRPGEKLPSEPELAHQLGVGRSAVREAMKVMAALGVVNIRHGSGTYIADKPSQNMLSPLVFAVMLESNMTVEFFELRLSMQLSYSVLASQNANAKDWQRIEAAAQSLEDYALEPEKDIETLTQLDLNFHYAILEATHNPLLIKIGRTVEELFFTSIHNTLAAMNQPQNAIDSHKEIIQAMRDGDIKGIQQAVEESLTCWRPEVEDVVRRTTLKDKQPKANAL